MREMWKKGPAMLLTACVVMAGFGGCGAGGEDYPKLEGQSARDTFEESATIQLTGDIDDVNTFSDVIADGQNVGEVKEHGLIDNKITYSVDGEDQFYVTFCNYEEEDKVVESEEYACSTTYTYYDMENNRLGYAQDRALFQGDDEWYVMVFLDTEGNMKNYYIEAYDDWDYEWADGGAGVYNMEREKVGEITLELTNVMTNSFAIGMDLGEAAGELSEMDRVAIYWRCVSEMNNRYGDR